MELGCMIQSFARCKNTVIAYETIDLRVTRKIVAGVFFVTATALGRSLGIMNPYTRVGVLVAALALVANFGCAKSSSSEEKPKVTETDKQGQAHETLLVLKFHHDN